MSSDLCVAKVPYFARLSPDQQREVARYARPVAVEPGAHLVRAGQRLAQLFVVHAGRVKVTRTSADGREVLLDVLERGDVGGETWFLTGDRPEHDCIAMEPSRICAFDHDDLAHLIRRFPDIGVEMLRALAQRLNTSERMLADRTLSDAGARVAAYLLDLPTSSTGGGQVAVRLPLTKKDIAVHLGTSPETLSRRLAEFERDGLVRLEGSLVHVLDAARLDARTRQA